MRWPAKFQDERVDIVLCDNVRSNLHAITYIAGFDGRAEDGASADDDKRSGIDMEGTRPHFSPGVVKARPKSVGDGIFGRIRGHSAMERGHERDFLEDIHGSLLNMWKEAWVVVLSFGLVLVELFEK